MAATVEPLEPRRLMSATPHVVPASLAAGVAGEDAVQLLGTLLAAGPDAYHGRRVTVNVRWGDHTKSKGLAAAYSEAMGGFVATGGHTYADAGDYRVTVAFHRGARTLGRYQGRAAVALTPVGGSDLSAAAGRPFSGVVGTFAKGTFPPYGPVVDWGDGSTSAGELVDLGGAGFAVAGTHAYAVPGTYRVAGSVTYTFRPTPPGQPAIGAPVTSVKVIDSTIMVSPADR